MKSIRHILILMTFIFSSFSAKAEERPLVIEPAPNALTLVGKGIRDRELPASLAMACVGVQDPNTLQRACDQLRWVLFVAADQAYYVGQPLAAMTQGQMKQYLKGLSKEAKNASKNSLMNIIVFGGSIMLVVAGVATFGTTTPLMVAAGSLVTIQITGVVGWMSTPTLVFQNSAMQAQDQSGWNWSSSPTTAKHVYFTSILEQVLGIPNLVKYSDEPLIRGLLTGRDLNRGSTHLN